MLANIVPCKHKCFFKKRTLQKSVYKAFSLLYLLQTILEKMPRMKNFAFLTKNLTTTEKIKIANSFEFKVAN